MADESVADFMANTKVSDWQPAETQPTGEVTTDAEPVEEVVDTPVEEPVAEVEKTEEQPEAQPEGAAEEAEVPEVKEEVPQPTNGHMKDADWREVIKKADRTEALKELGLDQFELDLIEHRRQTGDVLPYLEAKSVDYTKMSDEEIMKRNIQSQYKELSADELELLYRDEVIDKYKLDPDQFDERQVKLGQVKLKADAERVRQSKIEEQKKFTIPVKEQDNTTKIEQERQQAELEENQRKWVESVQKDKATTQILQSKKLVLGDAKNSFSYEIDNPDDLKEAAVDTSKFFGLFNKDGQTDLGKYYRVVAYAKDPSKFEKALIKHGESLGRKAEVDELKNPSKPNLGGTPVQTFKDEIDGVANAFRTKAVHKQ